MFPNGWFKKEKPLPSIAAFGGGIGGLNYTSGGCAPGEYNIINIAPPTSPGTAYNLTDGESWASPTYGPYLMTVTSAGEWNGSEVGMWAKSALWGAGGGIADQPSSGGGGGGAVVGEEWLVSGSTYNVWDGQGGGNKPVGGTPSFGNGGAGEPNGNRGGGGGLSGIFAGPVTQPNARLIAAGGGAGGGPAASWVSPLYGGAGGYPSGEAATGPNPRGQGGTPTAGGAGGNSGNAGSALTGAAGGFAGGGAGWYGGGSGSDNGAGSPGGGGGSNYSNPDSDLVKNVTHYSGIEANAGGTPSTTPSPYYSPGTANGSTTTDTFGENGYMKIMNPTA